MATAVIAIPVATAVGANASPHSPEADAASLHLDVRLLHGQHLEVRIDHCGVSERFSDRHLGIKQSLSICC